MQRKVIKQALGFPMWSLLRSVGHTSEREAAHLWMALSATGVGPCAHTGAHPLPIGITL